MDLFQPSRSKLASSHSTSCEPTPASGPLPIAWYGRYPMIQAAGRVDDSHPTVRCLCRTTFSLVLNQAAIDQGRNTFGLLLG